MLEYVVRVLGLTMLKTYRHLQYCFGDIKNDGFFLRRGVYVFFPFESLSGFDPPIAQTRGPVERNISLHQQLDPFVCGTVRTFSRKCFHI